MFKNRKDVDIAVKALPDEWKGLSLINNAGLASADRKVYDDNPE